MTKTKIFLLVCFCLVITAGVLQSKVLIIEKLGFFSELCGQKLKLEGNCNDPDGRVSLKCCPHPTLKGFGSNPPIELEVKTDFKATATVPSSGEADIQWLSPDSMQIDVHRPDGTGCTVIATGTVHECPYTVAKVQGSGCSLTVGNTVCAPCPKKTSCNTYTGVQDWVYDKAPNQSEKCKLELSTPTGNCTTSCSGGHIHK